MKLYKYYSVNKESLSSLINKYVWYSSSNDFNDPFDTKIIENELLQNLNFSIEKILCLSALNDNILMWAHYADSHKGFCVEFTEYSDEQLLSLKNNGIYPENAPNEKLGLKAAKKVKYKSTLEIEKTINEIPMDDKEFMNLYRSLNEL